MHELHPVALRMRRPCADLPRAAVHAANSRDASAGAHLAAVLCRLSSRQRQLAFAHGRLGSSPADGSHTRKRVCGEHDSSVDQGASFWLLDGPSTASVAAACRQPHAAIAHAARVVLVPF
eukprot:3158158-Prymnesium_polylepis.1